MEILCHGDIYWKDLITLCEDCHRHLHAKDETPIYDINMRKINDELKTCDRCGELAFCHNIIMCKMESVLSVVELGKYL